TVPQADTSDYWYAALKLHGGREVTRKLTQDEVVGLIKSGAAGADTPLSRTRQGGYRALATYPEFEPILRGQQTKARADRKAEKYRALYQKIEAEERSRQRWRWFHNLLQTVGGWVALLIWLAILAGAAVGVYFLIRWLIDLIGQQSWAK